MIKLGDPRSKRDWLRVVGVARAIREFENDPDLKSEPQIYVVPGTSTAGPPAWPYFVARATGNMALASVQIRREVTAVLPPNAGVFVRPWLSNFESMVQAREFLVSLFVAFGTFALGLAAVGLYGVLAYAVGQRMREFAVRVALGARPRDVLRLVLHDGLVMVLAGTAAGAFLAMWTARLLRTWLYDVSPMDASSLVMAELALFAVSLLACLAPALRATRANPLEILRAT
jgi:ABC-type antimicrobial peptide transport system permease subunit